MYIYVKLYNIKFQHPWCWTRFLFTSEFLEMKSCWLKFRFSLGKLKVQSNVVSFVDKTVTSCGHCYLISITQDTSRVKNTLKLKLKKSNILLDTEGVERTYKIVLCVFKTSFLHPVPRDVVSYLSKNFSFQIFHKKLICRA